jgi:hypothetical protein
VALSQQTSLLSLVAVVVVLVVAVVQVDYCFILLSHLLQAVIQLQLVLVVMLVTPMLEHGTQLLTDLTLSLQL